MRIITQVQDRNTAEIGGYPKGVVGHLRQAHDIVACQAPVVLSIVPIVLESTIYPVEQAQALVCAGPDIPGGVDQDPAHHISREAGRIPGDVGIIADRAGLKIQDPEAVMVVPKIQVSVTIFRTAADVRFQSGAVLRRIIPGLVRQWIVMLQSGAFRGDPDPAVLRREDTVQGIAEQTVRLVEDGEFRSMAVQDAETVVHRLAPQGTRTRFKEKTDDLIVQDTGVVCIPNSEAVPCDPGQPVLGGGPYHPPVVDGQVHHKAVRQAVPGSDMADDSCCPPAQGRQQQQGQDQQGSSSHGREQMQI